MVATSVAKYSAAVDSYGTMLSDLFNVKPTNLKPLLQAAMRYFPLQIQAKKETTKKRGRPPQRQHRGLRELMADSSSPTKPENVMRRKRHLRSQ